MDRETALVDFANDAFYAAFNSGDKEGMAALWAGSVPVTCIHPGWPPTIGRDDVVESWNNILGAAENRVMHHTIDVFRQGEVYSVLCYEELPGGWLIATNNFVIEGGEAKIIHHQAGPCQSPDALPDREAPQ